jgi:hypothetical protein
MTDGLHLRVVGGAVVDLQPQAGLEPLEAGHEFFRLDGAAVGAVIDAPEGLDAQVHGLHEAVLLAQPGGQIPHLRRE